jgi:two-component system OmpR family response regulator
MAMESGKRSARRPNRILVVEDEPEVRALLSMTLELAGYEVDAAPDGHDALLQLQHSKPDLILLDLMLPGMDGWQVIDAIRSTPSTRDLRIVAISARFGLLSAFARDVQAFVPKPFDTEVFLDILDEVLRQEMIPARL